MSTRASQAFSRSYVSIVYIGQSNVPMVYTPNATDILSVAFGVNRHVERVLRVVTFIFCSASGNACTYSVI